MSIHRQLERCLQLIEGIERHLRSGKLHKLPALQAEYAQAFDCLREGVSASRVDDEALRIMVRLEQQQRRLQRYLAAGLKESGEKLSVIEETRKRLQVSSQLAASLSL